MLVSILNLFCCDDRSCVRWVCTMAPGAYFYLPVNISFLNLLYYKMF